MDYTAKMDFPAARLSDVVTQEISTGELLIYDLKINKAYSLNKTVAQVWQAADGLTSREEIACKLGFPSETFAVEASLDLLARNNLLLEPEFFQLLPETRRDFLFKLADAVSIALPVITSIIAPKSVNAASGCVYTNPPCNSNGTFCSTTRPTDCCSCNCVLISGTLGRCT